MVGKFSTAAPLVLLLSNFVAVEGAPDKVIICHLPPGNPANFHDIEVNVNAVNAHVNHGDLEGACEDNLDDLCPDSATGCNEACEGRADTICIGGVHNDPHLQGLHGQDVEWHGVDGEWYSLLVDEESGLQVNMRPTAPLPDAFPERQYITGIAVLSGGHSLVVEVNEPHSTVTGGCPEGVSPCLADGGLRISVDGEEVESLLSPATDELVSNGITMSTSNLPAECREFGGRKAWAHVFSSARHRHLMKATNFGDWFLASSDHMVSPDWCAKYIAKHGLAQVQSNQSILKIVTPNAIVRFAAGVNHRSGGKVDRYGRELPELDFWQGSVALSGPALEHEDISGMLGETARPTKDEEGHTVTEGLGALRGTVEDYRVSGPLATNFAPLM